MLQHSDQSLYYLLYSINDFSNLHLNMVVPSI
nr:MAG TPA: hypothetical protein [Caudoviricetes sp.]